MNCRYGLVWFGSDKRWDMCLNESVNILDVVVVVDVEVVVVVVITE